MKRVGFMFFVIFMICGTLWASPEPKKRLAGTKEKPIPIGAMAFGASRLYAVNNLSKEIIYLDFDNYQWISTGIRLSPKAQITDLYVEDGKLYLLDAKNNEILIFEQSGALKSRIQTKGVKELKFTKAKRILVNYQGIIFVMDSKKLFALSQEGMLMASCTLSNPVSMSLGEDQLIRVLQHTKSGSEIVVYDMNLVVKSRSSVRNSGKAANYIIDMAVNHWGELHVLNKTPMNVSKLTGTGLPIAETSFGSQNKSPNPGSFQTPAILKCGSHQDGSLIAIYDSGQRAIHIFLDNEPSVTSPLQRPPYTMRLALEESNQALAKDYLPTPDGIFSILNLNLPGKKGKPGPVVVYSDRAGNVKYHIYLKAQKEKSFQDWTALAYKPGKLYVLDSKSCFVHIFEADTGKYLSRIGGKGSQNGSLMNPSSIVVTSDGNLYVADTGNRRISVFNQHDTFSRNISLLRNTQRPTLLRSTDTDLYCLSDDSVIMKIALQGGQRPTRVASEKGISSFDIIADGRLAYVDKTSQKLKIYNGNIREYELLSRSSTGNFPHFASIYMIRFDTQKQSLAIMDSKTRSARFLNFYPALDDTQTIRMVLNEQLNTVLSWEATPGINNWNIQANVGLQPHIIPVSQAKYEVLENKATLITYKVSEVADDGKRGSWSDGVEDHFSHGKYLFAQGEYHAAVEAFRRAQQRIIDPRIDGEIIKCYVAESDRYVSLDEYDRALDELRNASRVSGTSTDIALRSVNIYTMKHDYLSGITYIEGQNYTSNQTLLKEYITLKYLTQQYDSVILEADRYELNFNTRDQTVTRYWAASYEARGDYQDALAKYQELLGEGQTFEDNLKIGELQLILKQYRAAETHLSSMLTRYPYEELNLVRNLLGKCSMQGGSYGLAIDHFLEAIRLNPAVAEYHNNLGTAYLQDNNINQAQDSFRKAHELAPAIAQYGLDYADLLNRNGRNYEALAVLDAVASYVANNDTAVDFHLLYAKLLRLELRLEEARDQIVRASSYRPDDYEISTLLSDINTELSNLEYTRNPIDIIKPRFDPINPSLDQYYRLNPIGSVTLYNNKTNTIKDATLKVFVHEVGKQEKQILIPAVIPKEELRVDIMMDFSDRLFDHPRSVNLEIQLDYSYEGRPYSIDYPQQQLEIRSNKAFDWKKRRSLASFVNPQDSNLGHFVRNNISTAFREQPSNVPILPLMKALQVYSFYRANGIGYGSDSSISNQDTSVMDEVQFPHQLLASKSGDCEDLIVLLASTLESMGVVTAFIDVPMHVMLAVRTEMTEAQILQNGLVPEYFIAYKGAHWFPLESTILGKADFITSWLTAIRTYQELITRGEMPEIIEFADAHKSYPPSSFTRSIDASSFRNISEAVSYFQQDVSRLQSMSQINRELSFSEALEAYPDNNSVRLQYARYSYEQNLLEQAERLYKEVLNRDPGDFTALINLGNLYAETSRPQLAREKYLQALDHATDTDNVYRNLCLLEHRNMNRSEAKKYFNLIQRKEIIRAVDSQIYLDLLDSGD